MRIILWRCHNGTPATAWNYHCIDDDNINYKNYKDDDESNDNDKVMIITISSILDCDNC